MIDFFRPGLPILFVALPILLAWRAWLYSNPATPAGLRKSLFSAALYVASADVALTSFLWLYYWATPFSGNEIIRWAFFFGVPVSVVAIVLLAIARGRGWWLALASSGAMLGGWITAFTVITR